MHSLYIIWEEKYNLGIPIIDEQHRTIVSSINTYHYFVTHKKEEFVLKPILVMLDQYTKTHFITEEDILNITEYPDALKHKELHDALIKKMIDIDAKIAQNNDSFIVLNFLKQWWLNHIRVEDAKYAFHAIEKLKGV